MRRNIISAVLACAIVLAVAGAVVRDRSTGMGTMIALRQLKGDAQRLTYALTNSGGAAAATLTVTPGGPNGLQNGFEYAATFRPYGPASVWNRRISEHPTIASFSAAVVAHQFPDDKNTGPFRSNEAGQYDYQHPIFYATASDPLVSTRCNQYCGTFPAQIRIPPKARPAGGGDAHFEIVQPDGTDISLWATYGTPGRDWQTGDTVTAGNVSSCGNFFTGSGTMAAGPAATAGGACLRAGEITAAELAAGQINHALFAAGPCAVGSQYPAFPGASTDECKSGVGPPLGAREWYDVPCSETKANPHLRPWEIAILCALHDYGAYVEDDGGGGAYFTGIGVNGTESTEPAFDYGQPDPFSVLAAQGWYSIMIQNADKHGTARVRWIGADPWNPPGIDFPHHIHWLARCSAQGSC